VIPGLTTRISERASFAAATTITPRSDLSFVSGTTNVQTILPPFEGFSGVLFLVATDPAGFATVTGGNIALAVALTTNKATMFVYSKKNALWYPGAIS
jgi:hypothetical protein